MVVSWSYVAGFFDADGSVYKDRNSWRLSFTNNKEDVIDIIYGFLMERGVNVKKYDKREHNSDDNSLELRINTQEDVYKVANQLMRFGQLKYKHDKLKLARREIRESGRYSV